MSIASINPATGATLRTFEPLDAAQLEARLARAADAFRAYRRTSFAARAAILERAAQLLEDERTELGRLATTEMGKPLRAASEEVAKCATSCLFYAAHGAQFLADETVATNAAHSFVRYAPLGVVLAVMPWNFPFWQVFRFAAPALMAGNASLLKHASNVPQCALSIEDLWRRAGLPDGVFQTLLIDTEAVGHVIDDPRVVAVTLTGSDTAGAQVAARAGRALKKTVLELGGSDPFMVLPSADLESAVVTAVKARLINNGQSCIAAKRFIVHEAIYDEFERRFVAGMAAINVGDPLDPATELGPLATPGILESLDAQVQKTLAAGARLLLGGHRLARPGNFYAPTVLAGIPPDSPAWGEELFGPVASLFRARDLDHAIEFANATSFGLAAAVWTQDAAEQARCSDAIEAGQVFFNALVASDPRLPFGGVKRSGYGRELGVHGIREFVNVKTVWVG